ncbi:MAG: HyaD/HybD family hydrogenase maturation endopeptidase [Selenomonadaceae bacterium]|nr:HyaD/HybD family hydrogenase maturation endopeptidase [Selenomonadaceae bacterium]
MESLFTAENTVLGIGNIILSDEGFGVRVVEYLEKNFTFPDNVNLIDGGTLGVELTHFITGTKRLLIIDSINGGAEAGATFHLRGDEIKKHFAQKISAHEVGIQDILTMLELSGRKIPHVELIGAQPFSLEAGTELTPLMQKLLPVFADKAVEILKSWGLEIEK